MTHTAFARSTIAFIGLLLLAGCGASQQQTSASSKQVQHIVVCWLKAPGNYKARQELIEGSKKLSSIPGVVNVSAGTVIPSRRDVVDDSFDVAIIFTLENREALDAYLEHPDHLKAVREVLQPLVQRFLIYDIEE